MALHNLIITVVDGGKSTSNAFTNSRLLESDTTEKKDQEKNILYKVLNYNQTFKEKISSKMTPTTFFAAESGFQVAKQSLQQVANYYISDIGRSNGDSNYQAQVNRTLEVVGDIGGVIGGSINGAAAGSMFGPMGALVGSITGFATSAISTAFKYKEKERAYQHEMFKENTSQAHNLARANYSSFTGRLR